MKPFRTFATRTRNFRRFLSPVLFALACGGFLVLAPAGTEAQQSVGQASVVPEDVLQPDWSAPLIHPLDQMRADLHWRVYAAVITRDHKTLQGLLDAGDSPDGY